MGSLRRLRARFSGRLFLQGERLAALIPLPRRHRHRYYGVLAPNAPLRVAVTVQAVAKGVVPLASAMTEAVSAPESGATVPNAPDEEAEEPALRRAAGYVWALLLPLIGAVDDDVMAVSRKALADRCAAAAADESTFHDISFLAIISG